MFDFLKNKVTVETFEKFAKTMISNIENIQQLSEVSIKNYVNELEKTVTDLQAQLTKMSQASEEKIKNLESIITSLQQSTSEIITRAQLKNSDEPWIELLGSSIDPEKGLKLHLDWNDAFIAQLRAQGYAGSSESALIALYLKQLSDTINNEGYKQ